jgi:hypothetical protein
MQSHKRDHMRSTHLTWAVGIGQPGALAGIGLPQRIHVVTLEAAMGSRRRAQQPARLVRVTHMGVQGMRVGVLAFALEDFNDHRGSALGLLLAQGDGLLQ